MHSKSYKSCKSYTYVVLVIYLDFFGVSKRNLVAPKAEYRLLFFTNDFGSYKFETIVT